MEIVTMTLSEKPLVCQVIDFTEGCDNVTWVKDKLTLAGDPEVIERTIETFCCEGFL